MNALIHHIPLLSTGENKRKRIIDNINPVTTPKDKA